MPPGCQFQKRGGRVGILIYKSFVLYNFVFRYCMYMCMKVTVWRQIIQITFAGNQENSQMPDA